MQLQNESWRQAIGGVLVGSPAGLALLGMIIALLIQYFTGASNTYLFGNPEPTPLWIIGMGLGIFLWFALMTIGSFFASILRSRS